MHPEIITDLKGTFLITRLPTGSFKSNVLMKKQNSNCEFNNERSELLLRNFRESIANQSKISLRRALKEVVNTPAPRFWVSEARATRVISLMLKDDSILEGMHSQKRQMYREIYDRVMDLKDLYPDRSLGDLVFEVVNSEAPKFYMTPKYAGELIYKYKQQKKYLKQNSKY